MQYYGVRLLHGDEKMYNYISKSIQWYESPVRIIYSIFLLHMPVIFLLLFYWVWNMRGPDCTTKQTNKQTKQKTLVICDNGGMCACACV